MLNGEKTYAENKFWMWPILNDFLVVLLFIVKNEGLLMHETCKIGKIFEAWNVAVPMYEYVQVNFLSCNYQMCFFNFIRQF